MKVTVNKMTLTALHVSQNVPNNSPVEVSITDAYDSKIHCSQVN